MGYAVAAIIYGTRGALTAASDNIRSEAPSTTAQRGIASKSKWSLNRASATSRSTGILPDRGAPYIEAALAHVVGDAAEQAYVRADMLARRRQLMETWAEYCSKPDTANSVVVPLRLGADRV